MKKIVITVLMISIGLYADFSKSGNIVTDSTTGLQWQDDAVGSTMTWQSAIDYCEALVLDSYDDWRLPNKNELITIIDYDVSNPAMDNHFQNTISNRYWSSTTHASNTSHAWFVGFSYGDTDYDRKYYSNYVRCVRAGQ